MTMTNPNRVDLMLLFLDKTKPGIYTTSPEQIELMKQHWDEIHIYCKPATFTISEKGDKIRKDVPL